MSQNVSQPLILSKVRDHSWWSFPIHYFTVPPGMDPHSGRGCHPQSYRNFESLFFVLCIIFINFSLLGHVIKLWNKFEYWLHYKLVKQYTLKRSYTYQKNFFVSFNFQDFRCQTCWHLKVKCQCYSTQWYKIIIMIIIIIIIIKKTNKNKKNPFEHLIPLAYFLDPYLMVRPSVKTLRLRSQNGQLF